MDPAGRRMMSWWAARPRQYAGTGRPLEILLRRGGRGDRLIQRLIEIGDNVVDMFDPDREPDIAVRDAGGQLIFRRKLAVGRAGGMNRQ